MQSISSLISRSVSLYTSNFKLFIIIMAVPALITAVATYFEPAENEVLAAPIAGIYLVFAFLSVVASILMTIAVIHAIDDASLAAKETYKRALRQFLKYLGFIIVLSIILIVAFILLVIPGIWLSISFSFAMFILLLQNASIKDSLTKSFNMVKGKWWGVFGRTLILGLLSIGFILVLEVISMGVSAFAGVDLGYALSAFLSFLLTPFSTAYMYLIFRDLQGQ